MKKFIRNTLLFCLLVGLVLVVVLLSPTTYSASQSMLFSSIKKDSLLQHSPQPRVILTGGSSLSYGLASKLIKDSLDVNVINNGIHAGLGLKFILDSTEPYLKSGDIYIIAPEYEQYYENAAYGSEQLLRMVFDVSISNSKFLNWAQVKQTSQFVPQYIKSKLQLRAYHKESIPRAYRHTAFNEYGDAFYHWDSGGKVPYGIYEPDSTMKFNNHTLEYLLSSVEKLREKGVITYITFPAIQDASAVLNKVRMDKVYNELERHNAPLLGKPEDYIVPDSLTYDTNYHLNYQGAIMRTNTLIKFLKQNLAKEKI